MIRIKKIVFVMFALGNIALSSCTKEVGPLSDFKPDNSIIVSNAIAFRPEPTVVVSKSLVVSPGVLGPIQIVLTLGANSTRKIASITKVAAATSYSQIQGLTNAAPPFPSFYNTAPIVSTINATGKSATFNTTLTEYIAKTGQPVAATNSELGRRFYFLITLDDNSEVISEPVRVLVAD
jgi:hypothetical protein